VFQWCPINDCKEISAVCQKQRKSKLNITLVACSYKSPLRFIQTSYDRRVRDQILIIPQYSKTELIPVVVVNEIILGFIPGFSDRQRIFVPGLPTRYGFHEAFNSTQTV
jgi:hypothetical protein